MERYEKEDGTTPTVGEYGTLVEVDLAAFVLHAREDAVRALQADPHNPALREQAQAAVDEAYPDLKHQGASEELLKLVAKPLEVD